MVNKGKTSKQLKRWQRVYFSPSNTGSFGGINRLKRALNKTKKDRKASTNKIKNFLKDLDTYTLHKPVRNNFPRRRVLVTDINKQWQADLCDMRHLSQFNSNYNYILTVIDVFSKNSFARAIKKKTSEETAMAFKDIIDTEKIKPLLLHTDKGVEFRGGPFQKLLKDKCITFFTTENEQIKAQVCERFNRTLKEAMYRYFTHNDTKKYIDVLQQLISGCNNRYHSTIKMTPNEVNKDKVHEVYYNTYLSKRPKRYRDYKFQIGTFVRISKNKGTFAKSYLGNWSKEVFKIVKRKLTQPPVYTIEDLNNQSILGTFYDWELQKVTAPKQFKVKSILDEKRVGNKIKYLVSWEGYDDSFNKWINKSQLSKYKN